MSEDPVEQGGRAMQQSFMQSMQTAAMVSGLFKQRAGEARSQTEFLQRMRVGDSKEARSAFEHQLRVQQQLLTGPQELELNAAKIAEVKQRTANDDVLHKEELRAETARIGRADADHERREKAGELETEHKKAIHDKEIAAFDARERRAGELHDLEVELKETLLKMRRRSAGFSDTLTGHAGKEGAAGASAAAHAAAQASAGLSEESAEAARAFDQRFTEDTGVTPDDFIDATVVPESEVPVEDVIDSEIVEGFDPAATADQGSAASSVFISNVTRLTETLTVLNHLEHEFPSAGVDPEPPLADGIGFEAAFADADPTDAGGSRDTGAGLDFGFDPPLASPAAPDPEVGL